MRPSRASCGARPGVQPGAGQQHPPRGGAGVVGLPEAVAQRELAPVARVQVFLQLVGPDDRRSVRIWLHPLGLVGRAGARPTLATPFSSSRPTVFSHSRRPYERAVCMSSTDVRQPGDAFERVVQRRHGGAVGPVGVRFQTPQPPIACRVNRSRGYRKPDTVRQRRRVGLREDLVVDVDVAGLDIACWTFTNASAIVGLCGGCSRR